MRRTIEKLSFMLFVGFLVIALPNQSSSKSGVAMDVIFSPTGEKRLIHAAIMGEIKKARRTVDVAIFTFTSRRLSAALKEQAKRCRVRVLFEERSAKKISISQHKELVNSGVQVKFVRLPGTGFRAAKFHHKFCVIDNREVMTGSYNWTVGADEINHENLVIIKDKVMASKFSKVFERIWNDSKLSVSGK
jgi:phosphatidylserine/phosphatidylglycerophosphate/cardiolipin synthase-like enzyme